MQVLQLTGTPALDDLARSITDSVGSLVTLAAFGVILAFWVTLSVDWLVGFQTEKRRSDKYYYNSYNYPNYGENQTLVSPELCITTLLYLFYLE